MKILKAIFYLLALLPTVWTIYFIALVSRYWLRLGHIPSCYVLGGADLEPEHGLILEYSRGLLMIAFYTTPISVILFGILKFLEEKINVKILIAWTLSVVFMLFNIFVYDKVYCWYMD